MHLGNYTRDEKLCPPGAVCLRYSRVCVVSSYGLNARFTVAMRDGVVYNGHSCCEGCSVPHAGKEVSMKVLILSVTAGYGHHATAQAIGDMLKSKGAEVDTLDVYAYISNLIKTTIDKGYLFSSTHMQPLYRLVYQLAENNGASYFNSAPSIINIINALGASKFAKVIANHVPDVIICTHVFAAQMVDELKKRKKLADIETIGIVTDYTLHPFWEDVPRVQYIVTAFPSSSVTEDVKRSTQRIAQGEKPLYCARGCKMASGF